MENFAGCHWELPPKVLGAVAAQACCKALCIVCQGGVCLIFLSLPLPSRDLNI